MPIKPLPPPDALLVDPQSGLVNKDWYDFFRNLSDLSRTISGGQLAFPATQNPSTDPNTLDDYEEGTWLPVLTFATPGNLSVTYSGQQGNYTKIGHRVWAYFAIETATFTHTTAAGACRLTGLPFTVAGNNAGISTLAFRGITKANYTQFMMYAVANSTRLDGVASGSGQGIDNFTAANMPSGGSVWLEGTTSYTV